MVKKYQAPSVKKAFQILRLISETDGGLGVSALAKTLAISKSTVHGIVAVLEQIGAVMRNPLNKRYTLGYTVVELGEKGLARIPLITVARMHLEALMADTEETVVLGVLKDAHILILDVVESKQEIKITAPSGTNLSLTGNAAGKVFLAHMDEKTALKYLTSTGLVKYTENTITEVDQYLQAIQEVRNTGVATDYEEYFRGVRAVAALVKTDSPLLAAIFVVGFSSSLTDDKMKYAAARTLEAAQTISRDLNRHEGGYVPPRADLLGREAS